MQSSKSKLTIWGFLKSTGHQRNAAAVQRSVWLLFSRCVPAAHNEHQSGVVRVRVNVAEAWCRIQSFQDDLSGTWRNCEGIGSVGVMVHSLELTSGERELVPGKQQSTSKKAQRVFAQRSVYIAEISSSPSLSPLASGRAGVYQRRTVKGFERFSTLSFSAPLLFEPMGVVSQRQSVNKCRWCKGSDGAEKRESAGLKRFATFGKMTETRPSHCQKY